MADNLQLVVTKADGTVVTITGTLTATITEAAPAALPPPPPPAPAFGLVLLPAGITPTIVELDALKTWAGEWDNATSGSATGATSYPVTIGGRTARAFPSDYKKNGGMRYHVQYAIDSKAQHFIYAGDLWIEDPTQIAQMELDNNQVDVAQKVYIYGVQANKNSGKWDITKQDTACHWIPSPAKADPTLWPANKWLHFEIASHRDDAGNITYDAVHLDGVTQLINQTLPSARKILPVWGMGHLLVNLQLGGASNVGGSIRVYGNGLKVARW